MYKDRCAQTWKSECQGVGDIKEFTYYPKELHSKFTKLRAPWTYMTKTEKKLPAFQRPKKWFKKQDWMKVKKQKVFSLTTSNGKSVSFLIPSPWNAEVWAGLLRTKLAPFLKKAFPNKTSFVILLDGEKIFYAPAAKKAMRDNDVSVLKGWPANSPDLNPQEHVWGWAEEKLRELETTGMPFSAWRLKCLEAVKAYPSKQKLVGSMAKRVKMLIHKKGIAIGK